ncbi:MAG: hypothetical protein U1E57_05210 [Paenacidovorax caeni]
MSPHPDPAPHAAGPRTSFGYLVSPDGHQIERQAAPRRAAATPGRAGETVAVVRAGAVVAASRCRKTCPWGTPHACAPSRRPAGRPPAG